MTPLDFIKKVWFKTYLLLRDIVSVDTSCNNDV